MPLVRSFDTLRGFADSWRSLFRNQPGMSHSSDSFMGIFLYIIKEL
jgi:hypothetical protein